MNSITDAFVLRMFLFLHPGICLVENESGYDTSKVSHYPPIPGGGLYRSYGIFQVSCNPLNKVI